MITAILDTNVFVRAALQPSSPSARVVDAYLDGKFQLVLSQAVLQELLTVLILPGIRALHGWSDDEILDFLTKLPAWAALELERREPLAGIALPVDPGGSIASWSGPGASLGRSRTARKSSKVLRTHWCLLGELI